ncbi:MAG: nuclear transport factor 2 family protein [Gammaproteobacteria bacterium]
MKRHTKLAGILLVLGAQHGLAQQAADALPADLEPRLALLERQVGAAEALRAIRRLQWAYGHYSEFGLWHDFADLFADTGVGHYVQGDLDREGIRALFLEQVGQGRLGLADGRLYPHISFSPVVTLDDDGIHAQARFRILGMLGGYGGNATWFHGLYENAYVKERGVWKLNELTNAAQISGTFTAGLAAADAPPLPMHYAAEQVGSIALPPTTAPDRNFAALQQRLLRMQDEDLVSQLQQQFGYYFDRHDWDSLVELFADDATFEYGLQGVYRGKDSIRRALEQLGPLAAGQVDEHLLFQTYVSIAPDGQSAAARVDQLGMQGRQGGTAEWTQGNYENTFIRQNGQWRIQALHYYPRLITDYALGWARDAQPAPGPSADYPPDAPPTESYAIYPTYYLPAFHFAHPVTGRAPQYPEGSPAQAKAPGFVAAPLPPPAEAALDEASLEMADLAARRTLARDAVENLVNAFAYYIDACMTDAAAALFTRQATLDLPGRGRVGGAQLSAVLREHFCADAGNGVRTQRHTLQPLFDVGADAMDASVTTRIWEVAAGPDADDFYRSSEWHARAIPEGGNWKLGELRVSHRWRAPVNEGWAAPGAGFYLDNGSE